MVGMGYLRTVLCTIGVHAYEADHRERRVKCDHCEAVSTDLTLIRLRFELDAWERVESGEWDRDFAKDYIKNSIWAD